MDLRILVIFCILLFACQQPLQTVPALQVNSSSTIITTNDPCAHVVCAGGKTCSQGNCVCVGKPCGDQCLQANQCCSSDECPEGSCINNKCVTSDCNYAETFTDGVCSCTQGTTYCSQQHRCISSSACCTDNDCEQFQRCVTTNLHSRVCIQTPTKNLCKTLTDLGRPELFSSPETSFSIAATRWLPNGKLVVLVNQSVLTLNPNSTTTFANATISQIGIQFVGGQCREDNAEYERQRNNG